MDEEIDKWIAEVENPAPDVRLEPPPYCSFCNGEPPLSEHDNNSTDEVAEYWINWDSHPQLRFAHRLTHKIHGFTIVMHECDEIRDWHVKLTGPLPQTRGAIKELSAFVTYAVNVAEKRGQKPKITLSKLYAVVRSLPDTAGWDEVLNGFPVTDDFTVTYDAVKAMLKRHKIKGGLVEVRRRAKLGYE